MNGAIIQWGLVLLAQAAQQPAVDSPAPNVRIDSVWDFVIKGGPVMIPIGLCSLAALTVIVERLLSLRRSIILPASFLPGLKQALLDGDSDKKRALQFCELHPGPLANIFSAGIKKLGFPLQVLERAIEEAGQREIVKLRKYLRSLSVIASISPLLGLLGTIFGMITAFQTVAASAEALGRTELLAKGIYEAMITTAAGLLVAIPTVLAHHAFTARVERLVFEMDAMTIAFVEDFASVNWKRSRNLTPSLGPSEVDEESNDGRSGAVAAVA